MIALPLQSRIGWLEFDSLDTDLQPMPSSFPHMRILPRLIYAASSPVDRPPLPPRTRPRCPAPALSLQHPAPPLLHRRPRANQVSRRPGRWRGNRHIQPLIIDIIDFVSESRCTNPDNPIKYPRRISFLGAKRDTEQVDDYEHIGTRGEGTADYRYEIDHAKSFNENEDYHFDKDYDSFESYNIH